MSKIEGVYNIDDDKEEGEKELKLRVNEYGILFGVLMRLISLSVLRGAILKIFEIGKMIYDQKSLIEIKLRGKA